MDYATPVSEAVKLQGMVVYRPPLTRILIQCSWVWIITFQEEKQVAGSVIPSQAPTYLFSKSPRFYCIYNLFWSMIWGIKSTSFLPVSHSSEFFSFHLTIWELVDAASMQTRWGGLMKRHIYIYKLASRLKILRKSIHIPRREILIKSKQKLSEILIKSRQKVSETVCISNFERSNKFI